jgi:hypothetical protein
MRRTLLTLPALVFATAMPVLAQEMVSPPQGWGKPIDGLRLALSAGSLAPVLPRNSDFSLAIENVGASDLLLNLGATHAGKHDPWGVTLILTGPDGKPGEVRLESDRDPNVVLRGRIDDMVVALPRGATYVLRFDLARLLGYPRRKLKPGRYGLIARYEGKDAQFSNGVVPNISVWDFWKGIVQSNLVAFEIAD